MMLRRIRVKLHPTLGHRTRTASSAAVARADNHNLDAYGLAYGAGPSRIPYQPPTFEDRAKSHTGAKVLRERLGSLSFGSYTHPSAFMRSLFRGMKSSEEKVKAPWEDIVTSMSRLELHTIVHHLIRQKKGHLAAALILEALRSSSRMARRRVIMPKTLSALFMDRQSWTIRNSASYSQAEPNLSPSIAEQIPPAPSARLQVLLDLLGILQDVRYRRPAEMYALIVKSCCDESLPHLAAKVYVGLVEEWVTEGRVAEGASPEDFHSGGGPPRDRKLEDGGHWWTGVRAWRMPGEVLSPHDRLDLWHPRHLSLPEKMRNFPIPLATSPPTTVPQPHSYMLNNIIYSLKLDPSSCAPYEFASSMRALAFLANTVLSRTLPILGLKQLLQKCKDAPHKPDVYPEGMTPEKLGEDKWAYTAFSQVHITLLSLLWNPPISANSMRMIVAAHDAELASAPSPSDGSLSHSSLELANREVPSTTYSLPPLTLQSCTILLSYAFRKLRMPSMLTSLVSYMRSMFGGLGTKDVEAWNEVVRGASAAGMVGVAENAVKSMFGDLRPERAANIDEREFFSKQRMGKDLEKGIEFEPELLAKLEGLEGDAKIQPNEESLIALFQYLSATSQFDRMTEIIYIIIPYLSYSRSSSQPPVSEINEEGLEMGIRGRPRSSKLSPRVYLAILKALEKAGKAGLAQRVYYIALEEEKMAWRKYLSDHPSAVVLPRELRNPQELFTTILNIYSQLAKLRQIKGLRLPKGTSDLGGGEQAWMLAMEVHLLVRDRWDKMWLARSEMRERGGREYWRALISCCWSSWELSAAISSHQAPSLPLPREKQRNLLAIMREIHMWGMPVPDILRARLEGRKVDAAQTGNGKRLWQGDVGRQNQGKEAALLVKKIMGQEV